MADAEKKDIAQLDFNIQGAINSLDKIDQKLKSIAESSEAYSKKIGKNIGNSINNSININTSDVEKQLMDVSKLSKNHLSKTTSQVIKENAKRRTSDNSLANYQKKAAIDVAKTREKEEIKTTERVKREHAKQADSVKTLGDTISNYAKTYLIYQGFNQLKQGIKETIDEMVEIEYQMVQIDRVLNENSLNIDIYRDRLIKLAYEYGNSFNNVADITLRLAQAGYDSEEAIALTEKTLLALNTAELDATQATEDMVAVMAQWGLMTGTASEQAEEYGAIIDKINKAADNYPTTSEDILEALKKTSSAFNIAGASIDETIATIVAAETASQRGGKTIGTALSNIVQQFRTEGRLNLAKEMGLDFFTDADETEFRPIMEIFADMSQLMQNLKNEGKENSIEMQNLLEMFTVFRRNIGSSLLGEMAGEDSTYAQVMKDLQNSLGYSLQENEKHMKTAKAAQAQLNAEMLKLKTQVWEGGLEDVYRDMLKLGIDLIDKISSLIDKFGILPVSIGAVTAAITALKGGIKIQDIITLTSKVKDINQTIQTTGKALQKEDELLQGTSKNLKKYITSIDQGKVSLGGYAKSLVVSTAKTALLTAGTIALNAALTAGVSAITTFLISAIDNWIHAEEKAIEKNNELIATSEENAKTIESEITNIQKLRAEYEELAKKDNRTADEEKKIYEIQEKLNELLKETNVQVELINTSINDQGQAVQTINDKYDEQLSKLKAIEYEKKRQAAEELRNAAEAAIANQTGIQVGAFADPWGTLMDQLRASGIDFSVGSEYRTDIAKARGFLADNELFNFNLTNFDELDFEKQIKYLTDWYYALEKAKSEGKNVGDALKWVEENLGTLEAQQKKAQEAVNKYNDALAELYDMLGFADTLSSSLQAIADTYDIEGPKKLIKDIQNINTEFSNGTINIEEYFDKIEEKIKEIDLTTEGEELEAYQAIFAETTKSLAEGLEGLISGLESGSINFAEYAKGIKEAADNTLALHIEQNNLSLEDELWKDAAGNVDEYANSLQNAIDGLSDMGELLTVIGDNYDYIAEHANAAGEAMFNQKEVGTEAYNQLANGVAESLQRMKESNREAYDTITSKIFETTQASAEEIANADRYITEALNGNAQALNTALNVSAQLVAQSTNKVTTSMGKVLSELGKAISSFSYNITATPYISGKIGLRKDANGVPIGLELPSFGFDITGTGGDSVKNLGTALETFGSDIGDYASNKFNYIKLENQLPDYVPTTPGNTTTTGKKTKTGGGGSSSTDRSEYYAQREAEEAKKKEEEAYKARLKAFEDYIDETERVEKRWVDKQKELGQLTNEDYMYIMQQRIERYKKYIEEVKNATWMSEEDRLRLIKEYSEKIEDYQLDYLGYLEDQLNDEIDAIEKATDEKVKLIEEEANAKIEALDKVSEATDRAREKEDYEKERQSILEEISYWEQRTGREAQEQLKAAKEKLAELDAEWEDTQEDWSIEDQIKKIEEERDAEIKALEAEKEAEIKALKEIYDAKVKLFAETGQIIYEGEIIQSQNLYNAYKENFIDPISSELEKLRNTSTAIAPKEEAKVEQQYETYTIKSGDTLSQIAKRYGTTVEKIMAANPYVTNANRIYAGKTLQIPKFHEGGIVGGNQEAFALLKPNEVILKPEWADGINKLAKMARNENNPITNNSTVIEVKGDLVRIDANIKDKTDAEYLTRRIEKTLRDKFNIKK